MYKNIMQEIAGLYGKKLGQPFYISNVGDRPREKYLCMFTHEGFQVFNDVWNDYMGDTEDWLHDVVTGTAVIE